MGRPAILMADSADEPGWDFGTGAASAIIASTESGLGCRAAGGRDPIGGSAAAFRVEL
jgi:hypothetical protein